MVLLEFSAFLVEEVTVEVQHFHVVAIEVMPEASEASNVKQLVGLEVTLRVIDKAVAILHHPVERFLKVGVLRMRLNIRLQAAEGSDGPNNFRA